MKFRIKAVLFIVTAVLTIASGSLNVGLTADNGKPSTPRTDGSMSIWAG
ncbi:hypothetical protein ACFFLM_21640 [Deinococcus oregonensis]|uniref:Uncharacterized protein n=1 Tax=Deinococcus oregonensis TaxID=1805970 RepID=A0ABV6B6M5_9DEIO